MIDKVVPEIKPGIYVHYKSNNLCYEVIGCGLDSESEEPVVIYKPLYKSNVPYWVRPYKMFISEVEIEGKKVPRFKLLKKPRKNSKVANNKKSVV
jgi:hypothetical protein